MATYVQFVKLTDQGIRDYKQTIARAENYWQAIKDAGGRVVQEVWTTGEYDVVILLEAPDDETAAAASFQVSSLGNVRVSTSRGFTAEEMRKIVAKNK